MSLRLPGQYANPGKATDGLDLLDHEIAAEKAAALGRAGERVERSLAELCRRMRATRTTRARLLKAAAEAVYAYFIQRELCGLRRHQDVIREYQIPNAGAGAARREVRPILRRPAAAPARR